MKFFQWLDNKEAEKMPERDIDDIKPISSKKSELDKKIFEVENGVIDITALDNDEIIEKKFVHAATGKKYKTERALKAGITRYNKKQNVSPSSINLAGRNTPEARDKAKKIIKKMNAAENLTLIKTGLKYDKPDDSVNQVKTDKELKIFVDAETGKTYKTAPALKAGITRRLKKQKQGDKI